MQSTRLISETLTEAISASQVSPDVPATQQEEKQSADTSFETQYIENETLEWNAIVVDITMILAEHAIVMNPSFMNEIRQDRERANDYFTIIQLLAEDNLLSQRNFGKLQGLGELTSTSAYYIVEFSTKSLLTQSRFDFIYAQMACIMRNSRNEDDYLDSLENSLERLIKRKMKRKKVILDEEKEQPEDQPDNDVKRPRLNPKI
jgi:hypothetical protein